MSLRLSCSVMAHPAREREVQTLLSVLDAEVEVHWDLEGPPSGNHDRVWRQARAAWRMGIDAGADWHLVIQDDAIACFDLLAGLAQGLTTVHGDAVVSAYLGQGRYVPKRWEAMTEQADARKASWIVANRLMWGVAIALPTRLIGEMIASGDRHHNVPDDMRISGWAMRQGLDVWYTWPSLVDHRWGIPSLTKHNASDRIARRHHGESALEIDWNGPVVTDPMVLRHRGQRSKPSFR